MDRQEIKIFITFFFIYSFFIHWVGWNEQSRFALTRSIVDEGRLEINSFFNQTSDRSYYNGNYYSDKAPGTSFLATPIYGAWKFVYSFFPETFRERYLPGNEFITTFIGENRVPIYDQINPGLFILFSMILITIFTSSLFSAFLVVLIYKTSKYFTNNKNQRLLLTFTAGLGTLIFPYALVFMEHAVATFFAFFAFYLLFKIKQEKIKDKRYFLLAGLSSGFAITCSTFTIIIALAYLVYLFYYKRERTHYFLLGGLIGVLPFLVYNYATFGTPFTLPRQHLDPMIWGKVGGIYGFQKPNLFVALRLMFYPYKGLFFYYPVLILSFVGLYYMYREFKAESILIAIVFFAFLIMNSSWWAWWGGTSFGPRHLTPSIPFLVLPLVYVFTRFNKSKFFKYVVFLLIFYSIFINFLGLQPMPKEIADVKTVDIASEYKEKVNTFQVMINPLYEYYLPLFLKDGPRSRIFESLTNLDFPIDIRFFSLEIRDYIQYFYFYIPFLCLLSLFILLAVIWHREIFKKKKTIFFIKRRWKFLFLLFLLSATLIFLIFYPLPPSPVFYKGWYSLESTEKGRWMKDNGKLIVYNQGPKKTIQLSMLVGSYHENKDIEVYLNDEKIDEFTAFPSPKMGYNQVFNLKSGLNSITFKSKSKCSIPHMIEGIDDRRCLSMSLNFTEKKPAEIIFNKYWYSKQPDELRWMRQNGTIKYFNSDYQVKEAKIHIYSKSFYKDRTISLYLNGNFIDKFTVFKEGIDFNSSVVSFLPGENVIELRSKEGCTIVADVAKNNDFRCVSVGILNISIIPIEELEQTEIKFTFTKNWHDKDEKEEERWMKNDGNIIILNNDNREKQVKIRFRLKSFPINRDVEIYKNDELIDNFFAFKEGSEVYSPIITLNPGDNSITLHSKEECTIIADIVKNNDYRCISIGVQDISILTNDEIEKSNVKLLYNKNWYDKMEHEEEIWMYDNATISVFNFDNEAKNNKFYFHFTPFHEDKTVYFFLNGELKNIFDIKLPGGPVETDILPIRPGENLLRFHSKEKCIEIAKIVKNDDYRCVSLGLRDINMTLTD